MKRYTSSQARQRFAEVLNVVERGDTVVIERGQARFVLRAEPRPSGMRRRPSVIEYADPAVLAGRWTWTGGAGGMRFRRRGTRT